jgi:hypothetical protein
MRASDLIDLLSDLIEQHGDLRVAYDEGLEVSRIVHTNPYPDGPAIQDADYFELRGSRL